VNLLDIVHRQNPPQPWAEGEKIPWNEPEFSQRMLQEHLSQAHDSASRRAETIDRHVSWIHHTLLSGQSTRILDLGCGPGLYTSRLATLGHSCTGIDFSPASIAFAREQAAKEDLACDYLLGDVRTASYGTGYGLAMQIFGEFNVFTRADAKVILEKARASLVDGGTLLLEPHTLAAVCQLGDECWWQAVEQGLFSEDPHLLLYESHWDRESQTTTERYHVVDAATGSITRHASTMQAYTDAGYQDLLESCGFDEIQFYPSLCGIVDDSQPSLLALVAKA
jgi:SAM-dependent methyltransferase